VATGGRGEGGTDRASGGNQQFLCCSKPACLADGLTLLSSSSATYTRAAQCVYKCWRSNRFEVLVDVTKYFVKTSFDLFSFLYPTWGSFSGSDLGTLATPFVSCNESKFKVSTALLSLLEMFRSCYLCTFCLNIFSHSFPNAYEWSILTVGEIELILP
jgi:hypothetical protein